jgi:uncharacterized protein YcgI (DUF1989 family)
VRDLSDLQIRYGVDRAFYDDVRARARAPIGELIVPPGEGRGFVVKAGQTFRIIQDLGGQVAELALWNANDLTESYAAMRGRVREGVYIDDYTRFWSDVPHFRPLMTCVQDSARDPNGGPSRFHRFWAHCSVESMRLRGVEVSRTCAENLSSALRPFGLDAHALHDVAVLFQESFVENELGTVFVAARSGAVAGQYIEFYAEVDLVIALSSCPTNGNTLDPSVDEVAGGPLRVRIEDPEIAPRHFPSTWHDWRPSWSGSWRRPPTRFPA